MSLRRTVSLIVAVGVIGLSMGACSQKKVEQEEIVAGSSWLSKDRSGSMQDVLMYPLSNDELVYFESILPALEEAAARAPGDWESISGSEDPAQAAYHDAFWDAAGVSGADVIAASLKLTFLVEFASAEEPIEEEMQESLAWLEGRIQESDSSSELWQAANNIRAMLKVIEAHKESGAFAFYDENKARIDQALDRFTSIGEQ